MMKRRYGFHKSNLKYQDLNDVQKTPLIASGKYNYILHICMSICNSSSVKIPKIFVSETEDVNAEVNCSTICNTLVITRGAIRNLSTYQLTGLISHEIGHIIIKNKINNSRFLHLIKSSIVYPLSLIAVFCGSLLFWSIFLGLHIFTLNLAFSLISILLLKAYNRHTEKLADKAGAKLTSVNYLLDALKYFNQNNTQKFNLFSSHPSDSNRIKQMILIKEKAQQNNIKQISIA